MIRGILLKITTQDSSVEFVQYLSTSAFSIGILYGNPNPPFFSRIAMLHRDPPRSGWRIFPNCQAPSWTSTPGATTSFVPWSNGAMLEWRCSAAAVQQPGIPGLTRIHQEYGAYWRYFLVILVYWRCCHSWRYFWVIKHDELGHPRNGRIFGQAMVDHQRSQNLCGLLMEKMEVWWGWNSYIIRF